MTNIVVLGVNHRTAPVEVREQIALVCREDTNPLYLYPQLEHVEELFFLSTCNRVEFLFTCHNWSEAIREVKGVLQRHLGPVGSMAQIDSCLYIFHNLDAVRHLFRVASSLDSMVVGEPQILGQIKSSYREATQYRTVSVILNRLLHKSFSVAKRVRSETQIGSHAVSISYAAVELAKKIFGELADKRILLIGAGEMTELAAAHFMAQGVRKIQVANRTLERAVELAKRFKADTLPFNHIVDALGTVDIVVTSTGSPEAILSAKDVKSTMRRRKNRPLFFIDIAVPRDVDSKVNALDNVYLYDIDDLQGVVNLNQAQRQKEAERAEHVIEEETYKFKEWLGTLEAVPTIIALRQKAECVRQQELRKTLAHLPDLTEKQREAIEVLSQSIVNKLLHDPILFLKKKSHRQTKQLFMDYTQQLFNLSNGNDSASSSLDSMEG